MIDRTVPGIAECDMNKQQAGAAEKRDELAASHRIPRGSTAKKIH
jgi:hypothetical protein